MEAIIALEWAIDILLGSGLLWFAWRALVCPDLFRAIVMFIAFGLLMALAWVRLDAPDVALAEAAIGAGLTGALLLAAFARLRSVEGSEQEFSDPGNGGLRLQWLPLLLIWLLAVGLGYVIVSLPTDAAGLGAAVTENLADSGVSNPVTAVLLNYRSYDTLLETVVLLVALLAVWSFGKMPTRREVAPGRVLETLARLLAPVMILVAAYLLWVGAHAPGGAFQAGSVLSAAGVLMLLAGWRLRTSLTALPLRLVLIAGPAMFLSMAMVTLLIEGRLLEYPREHAGLLILVLEATATLSIAATLVALFAGGRPPDTGSE